MAVPGLRVPLPGGLQDEDDMDLLEPKRAAGVDPGGRGSPKKPRAAEEGVTMDALRTLLAEQSHSLLQAQQVQITAALASFEERQSSRLDKVEATIQDQGSTMSEVQKELQSLQERLAKVEQAEVHPLGLVLTGSGHWFSVGGFRTQEKPSYSTNLMGRCRGSRLSTSWTRTPSQQGQGDQWRFANSGGEPARPTPKSGKECWAFCRW